MTGNLGHTWVVVFEWRAGSRHNVNWTRWVYVAAWGVAGIWRGAVKCPNPPNLYAVEQHYRLYIKFPGFLLLK